MSAAGEETVPLTVRAARAFAAYVDGDTSLMSHLVDELTPLLWHVARGQGLPRETAEDVVQQTWLRLVEHAGEIHDPQSVVKWLMTTARREAWRSSRAGRNVDNHPDLEQLDDLSETATEPVSDAVIEASEQAVLWQHVAELSERCRHLLRVIAFADRPDYAAIAEALGMPVGSIGPTRGRCLATLRAALLGDPAYETGVR
ncbi:sigma-70 family RNA polymerase sigma factor [Nostocoides sp. F2B08]|uniref:RNA polymerase sigma factor n=1 Tax=Nostocoides sp. F2B08 TaxID=2653936 RepID=UPI0012637E2B|nr:sigma-70 family RNA polymerase sigma factor [Tetrasphaera sp. F2B08]KAB7743236.1 sigma-70 family RNA polymerase sigma factor [Tetrasphaera sp. F2B08]